MPRVVIDPAVPDRELVDNEITRLRGLDVVELRARWHTVFRRAAPPHLPRHLLFRGFGSKTEEEKQDGGQADQGSAITNHRLQQSSLILINSRHWEPFSKPMPMGAKPQRPQVHNS